MFKAKKAPERRHWPLLMNLNKQMLTGWDQAYFKWIVYLNSGYEYTKEGSVTYTPQLFLITLTLAFYKCLQHGKFSAAFLKPCGTSKMECFT